MNFKKLWLLLLIGATAGLSWAVQAGVVANALDDEELRHREQQATLKKKTTDQNQANETVAEVPVPLDEDTLEMNTAGELPTEVVPAVVPDMLAEQPEIDFVETMETTELPAVEAPAITEETVSQAPLTCPVCQQCPPCPCLEQPTQTAVTEETEVLPTEEMVLEQPEISALPEEAVPAVEVETTDIEEIPQETPAELAQPLPAKKPWWKFWGD